MVLGIICWIVLGLITGFIASKIVNIRDEDPKAGILVGGGGGVIGGWIFNAFSVAGAAGFNLWSLLWAGIGAAVALVIWHVIRSRIAPTGSTTVRRSY
jgi:uncharacterized membrane protein YeaQ/YmgE (transglycosylase-associated protein family)